MLGLLQKLQCEHELHLTKKIHCILESKLKGLSWCECIVKLDTKSEKCLLVINKRIHQQSLLDAFLPLRPFPLQVTVGVVGHDHSFRLVGQLDNETVVVANYPLSTNTPGRGEDNDFAFFKLHQDVLI